MLLQRVDRAWTRSGCLVFSRYLMGTGIKKALDLRERAIDAISKANLIRRSLNKLGENNTPRVLQGMDAISNEICAVMDVCELVRNCHMDDVYIDEAERTFQELHVYISELNTDKGLHLLLTKIVDNQIIFKSLSEEDKIIVVDLKREFEAAGVHIEEQTKREKSLELQRLTQEVENSYTRNAYNHFDTFRLGPIEDKDLFSSVQSFAAQFVSQPQTLPASTVLCNADNRLISNLLVSLDDEKLRKILWESSLMVPSGNVGALGSLIKTRQSLARALSHPSYAHKVLSNRMVKSPNQVWALLEKISQEINPSLLDQMKLLQGSSDVKIQPWNLPYLMNNYKYEMQQQGGARSLTAIAPFLSLSACVNSLKFVTHELFGIHVRERPLKQEELWGWSLAQERTVSGMMRLDLYDSSEEFLGKLMLFHISGFSIYFN
jgi:intermediate peptidase